MQVSIESLSGLERRMTVQVPSAKIESEIEQRLRKVSKTAKLKGFRPGKIPFKVVRQRFGSEIRREVLSDVMQSSYAEAVAQEKLHPAGGPKIKTSNAVHGADFEYEATFEVYPEVVLKKVEGLKVERPVAEVADDDIDRVMQSLREQRVHWHVVDRAAKADDKVVIDYRATINGEAFAGNEASAVEAIIGSNQMPQELEQCLIGASAGDELTQPVEFAAEHPAEQLAGKTADFAITVKQVEEKHLPELDDEFCKSFGVDGGLDELRNGIRENMVKELGEAIRGRLREQILNAMIEGNPVELPTTLIEQEVDYLRGDTARRMGISDPEKMPAAEQFQEPARRRVALGLLVAKVVETAGLEADPESMETRLQEMAAQFGEADQVMDAYRKDPRLMSQIEMAVVEEKAVDWLLDQAKIKDVKTTFKEVMNQVG
ncbi:MAG: trigger factor [Gammaproteobacteria bacterium]|nr:trigger factor [Gammaproteobacteria bacterium]